MTDIKVITPYLRAICFLNRVERKEGLGRAKRRMRKLEC